MKIIGKRKALQLLTTATILSYAKAFDVGLVDGALENDKVLFLIDFWF